MTDGPAGTELVTIPGRREWKHDPPSFWARPETSDRKAIEEVWDRDTYRRPRLGFTIDPGDRWVDAGSNVGAFACLAVYLGADEVLAIEADATNADITEANLALFGAHNADVIRAAVIHDAAPDTTVTLWTNPAPMALRRHSAYTQHADAVGVQVPTVNPAVLTDNGFDCWKLNIEGAEIPILLEHDLSKVNKLVAEWSFDVAPEVGTAQAALKKLRGEFDHVASGRNLDGYPPTERYEWWPPNMFVHAWNDR